MLTNVDLENILQGCSLLRGVTSQDRIKELKLDKGKCFIIVNTARFPLSGHWILLTFEHSVCEIFDSLGNPPEKLPSSILNFIIKNSKKIVSSNTAVQSSLSNLCGFFVIARILSKISHESLETFLDRFHYESIKNDKQVFNVIEIYSRKYKFFYIKVKKEQKKQKTKAKKLNVNVLYSAASAIFLLRWGLFSPCSALLEPFVCKLCKAFINSFSL